MTGWVKERDSLVREMTFKDFEHALRFVDAVARAAVDYQRRPDMCISEFNRVRLEVTNLHHAGITAAEERLVSKVDAVIEDHRPGMVGRDGQPPGRPAGAAEAPRFAP